MPMALSAYARPLLLDPHGKDQLKYPVLVWQTPPSEPVSEVLFATMVGDAKRRANPGDPVVFEVRKRDDSRNAFAFGVTVGRTENNDIVIVDNSVSRFHAYFRRDDATGHWSITDADSKNGSRMAGRRLEPRKETPLVDGAEIKFGSVVVTFFLPNSFYEYVRRQVRPA